MVTIDREKGRRVLPWEGKATPEPVPGPAAWASQGPEGDAGSALSVRKQFSCTQWSLDLCCPVSSLSLDRQAWRPLRRISWSGFI